MGEREKGVGVKIKEKRERKGERRKWRGKKEGMKKGMEGGREGEEKSGSQLRAGEMAPHLLLFQPTGVQFLAPKSGGS